MNFFKTTKTNQMSFNKKDNDCTDFNIRDYYSRFPLYIFKFLMFLGIFLIVFDNAGYLSRESYFGQYNWATGVVFFIGIILSYFAVPYLYYSSFEKYKKGNDFWDQEIFWILPLFFFANFFQYGSGIFFMLTAMIASIFIIFIIHARFLMLSKKMAEENKGYEKKDLYYENMKYLTAYYAMLLLICLFFNPAKSLNGWIAENI